MEIEGSLLDVGLCLVSSIIQESSENHCLSGKAKRGPPKAYQSGLRLFFFFELSKLFYLQIILVILDLFHFNANFIFIYLFFLFVVNFVIHWNETAMGLHVFPIPIPPPSSLSTRSP